MHIYIYIGKQKPLKPMSLLVSQTELFSSNRAVSNDQNETDTCTYFSAFIFGRTHPQNVCMGYTCILEQTSPGW